MSDDRIDFISAYCDCWCERCPYTERCSAYACQVAAAMCGDFEQGLELAIGTPQPEVGEKPERPDWLADFDNAEPSAETLTAVMAAAAARDERIKALPLATLARRYFMSSFQWLRDRSDALRTTADPVIVEALDIVAYDSALIGAKIHRALHGRPYREHDEDPVQNDCNGSAKVALISVDRSETAWHTIATVSSDPAPMILAEQLAELRRVLIDAFPQTIKRRFGAKSALDYLIGEKLISFADAARVHPAFAKELPRFLAAIWQTFNEYEIAGYLVSRKPAARNRPRRHLCLR